MKPVFCALLIVAASCSNDATAPARTPVTAISILRDARDSGEPSVTGSTTTFEDFSLGAIDGQHDWKSLGGLGAPLPANPLDTHCAVYDHEIADNTAASNAYRYRSFERKSLRISNAVTSGCYSDQTFSSRTANFAGQAGAWSHSTNGSVDYALAGGVLQNHFEAEWSFASTVPDAQQPGLEVVASPARGDDARMSWVQMTDLPDGLAVIFAERSNPASAGDFELSTVARRLDRRVPHTIRISMDFVDGPGNDIVRVFVDGDLKHTGTSWENYYFYDPNGKSNFGGAPPIVNRMMFRTGSDLHRGIHGDPAPATRGHGFVFDNLRQATFMVATSADACKNNGWRALRDSNGTSFENQGDCVSSVRFAQHGGDREH
jgi:hypothetical protein